jgi:sn-glycerol 3-phosphate transport system substrate-binding protein
LIYQNGGQMTNGLGTETFLDTPEVIEAVQYLVDLSEKHKVMRPGTLEWGATPKAFFEGQTAMMWTTTGNLTNVRKNAPFDFGVAMLPAGKSFGAPTGGGNFYIFKGTPADELEATKDFVKWMTAPDQAGVWTMATGYVAPRPDAWETQAMKDYVADFPPALVAKEQLAYADAEFSTYENPKTVKIFNTALENVMSGSISPADAMKQAQIDIDKILKDYR